MVTRIISAAYILVIALPRHWRPFRTRGALRQRVISRFLRRKGYGWSCHARQCASKRESRFLIAHRSSHIVKGWSTCSRKSWSWSGIRCPYWHQIMPFPPIFPKFLPIDSPGVGTGVSTPDSAATLGSLSTRPNFTYTRCNCYFVQREQEKHTEHVWLFYLGNDRFESLYKRIQNEILNCWWNLNFELDMYSGAHRELLINHHKNLVVAKHTNKRRQAKTIWRQKYNTNPRFHHCYYCSFGRFPFEHHIGVLSVEVGKGSELKPFTTITITPNKHYKW